MENTSLLFLLNAAHIEKVADVAFFIKFSRRIPVVKYKDNGAMGNAFYLSHASAIPA